MIRWPDSRRPERSSVHVSNEIDTRAQPEAVWAWLVRATLWPSWYGNSHNVAIEGGGSDLKAGSTFRWRTFGVSLRSHVEEFVPFQRLAWSADGMGVHAYHAWLVEGRPAGSHIITEETQNGWLARASASLRPNNMRDKHQTWLEALRAKAEAGLPA